MEARWWVANAAVILSTAIWTPVARSGAAGGADVGGQ
jgi:hypothetical protein